MRALDFSVDSGGPPEVVGASEERGFRIEEWDFRGAEGDRVRADAYLAEGPGPVVIVGHGRENSRRAQYVKGAALLWAPRGISVVATDAPRHGDRAEGRPVPAVAAVDVHLLVRWVRDHRLLIDAVRHRVGGRSPIGYVGFSMGAVFGTHLTAADDRIAAAVLVVGGSPRVSLPERMEPSVELQADIEATDPEPAAARIAPRPVLMLNADGDEVFSRRSALALYDALRPPKEITFMPGSHAVWRSPAQWHRRMLAFLDGTLGGGARP